MEIEVNYLWIYQKKIDALTEELNQLQQHAEIRAPQADIAAFEKSLHRLKNTIHNLNRPA